LCRTYEDGIGQYDDATHFGRFSMQSVLRRYCGEEVRPEHFDELDRLLRNSVSREQAEYFEPAEGLPTKSKVKKFRRTFFDQFTSDQIKEGLSKLQYREAQEFTLQSIVGEQTTDGYMYEWHTPQQMEATMSMESSVPDEQTFESETIDMQHLGAQFNLVDNQVTKHVTELVAKDAELLWSQLEPHIEKPEYDDLIDDITYLETMADIREAYFKPDLIIHRNGMYVPDRIQSEPIETKSDSTGVLPYYVTSVIADSGNVGYRVTRDEWSVEQPARLADPYRYMIKWTGNYAITQPDAFDVV
jgi:hypothetical protein